MKKIIFILFIAFSLPVIITAQEDYKASCRNHKSHAAKIVPTEAQLAHMESMAFRSDTFDIVHYSIYLDEVDYGLKSIKSHCDVHFFPKMEDQNALHLDLLDLKVDSVLFEGAAVTFNYDSLMLHVYFDSLLTVNDTSIISVYYGGKPTIDPSGFGGFDFQDGYAYNLGIGLASIPHNFGRGWFPCFDNFVERSTYDFFVTTLNTQTAYCVGTHISTDSIDASRKRFHYSMQQPITTYQAAVAIADYRITRTMHEGIEKEIPIELVSKPQDTTKFKNSFAFIAESLDALEYWYGPYQWERVGYVITTVGAMEHPTCVAYPSSLGLNENPYNNMDIMSHELAHHWFGNLTTLTTAYDMWIKEGTSEYGYHLFTKEFLGDEEFFDLIASNQFDVIENAHRNDDGYRALSGMPFEYTYGTTTYQKGAAVIHNMHSYLGDSLFKVGVRAILDEFAYSHCDAADFESILSAATGKDMSSFFNDWIYAPGFSAFEIDSMHVSPNGNQYDIDLFIEQKLFHAPEYHEQVPMEVSFFDADWNQHVRKIELSGQHSIASLSLDFEPVFQILNHNSFLNNGQLSYLQTIREDDKYEFNRSKLAISVEGLQDSLLVFVEHVYGAPDPILREDLDIELSKNHYWLVDGINPEDAMINNVKFYYEGNHEDYLDYDLTNDSEDDIILLYRRNASEDWVEYPYAVKNKFIPGDGKGFFRADSLLFGQFTFGNGDYFAVNTKEDLLADSGIKIRPNPASDEIHVRLENQDQGTKLQIINQLGQVIWVEMTEGDRTKLNISGWLSGIYVLNVLDRNNKVICREKFVKI